jgi:hypothetical protein
VNTIAIHTSDRLSFKGCRQRWDFESDLRRGYKPIVTPPPFVEGTAFHAAAEFYYNPVTWKLSKTIPGKRALIAGAIEEFRKSLQKSKRRFLALKEQEALDPEDQEKFLDTMTMGEHVLRHYFTTVQDDFTPVATEVGFEVPIFTAAEIAQYLPHLIDHDIVYRGRIDLIVQDVEKRLWNLDHKFVAILRDNTEYLEIDEQLGSYNWAFNASTGTMLAGSIYSEIVKAAPAPPARNATRRLGCIFSVSKSQPTTYELYVAALKEAGEDFGPYEKYLTWLHKEGPVYIRRQAVSRPQESLAILEANIKAEIVDMLREDVSIYPAPTVFKCNWCSMRAACRTKMDGGDVEWVLKTNYTQEKRTNA